MATVKEGWMKMPDGKELFTKSWLVLSHLANLILPLINAAL